MCDISHSFAIYSLKGVPQAVISLYVYATKTEITSSSLSELDSPYVMSVVSYFIFEAKKYNYCVMVEFIHQDENIVESQIKTVLIQSRFLQLYL